MLIFRWRIMMELLDIFYLWSVPYMIVEGSLLNLYRWVIVIVYLLYLDIYISTYNSNSRYFAAEMAVLVNQTWTSVSS